MGRGPSPALDDSKKLSARKREALAAVIKAEAVARGIAWATVEEIDTLNILQATLLAMGRAVERLGAGPGGAGRRQRLPAVELRRPGRRQRDGSIAPHRRRVDPLPRPAAIWEMRLHRLYPQYGFGPPPPGLPYGGFLKAPGPARRFADPPEELGRSKPLGEYLMNFTPLLVFLHVSGVVVWVGHVLRLHRLRPAAVDVLEPPFRPQALEAGFRPLFPWSGGGGVHPGFRRGHARPCRLRPGAPPLARHVRSGAAG